jgi:hypothetical protein
MSMVPQFQMIFKGTAWTHTMEQNVMNLATKYIDTSHKLVIEECTRKKFVV